MNIRKDVLMKHWMKYFLFAWFGAALLLAGGCCGGSSDPEAACIREAETNPVDYSDRANWVLLPDRTPEKLEPVDIFYIYPTVYVSRTHPVMHWDSPKMAAKTRNIALQQTGPFSTLGNVYAPFVRQGELHRALADLAERPGRNESMRFGFRDTEEAFRYYLEHWNGGRPFILVGHSQGAYDLLELLKREFREPALQKKLIAAYLIGCPVTDADLAEAPHLKTAEGPLDFGVIVSWNTEAPEAAPSLFTGRPGTRCINPLNWRTDAVEAPASANIGAVFFDGENRVTGEIPGFCSAKVEPVTGALVAVPQFPGQYDSPILGAGIYHMNDIYFFYRNIEVNARDRAANYFNSNERAE